MSDTTSRVLALLNLLQTHRQWAGADLAARLDVTERTLRRDIERLRALGYSVAASRGVAGGYRLEAGSTLPPLLLTDEEAVTMAIGLRVAATQGLVDGEQTTLSAIAKFEQVLPAGLRQRVNALAVSVQARAPRGGPVSHELLGRLALACRDHERIRFAYTAGDGVESRRVVEPHTVIAAERSWLLLCWDLDRSAWRTFRVDRLTGFFATNLHFSPRELPGGIDAADYISGRRESTGRISVDVIVRMPIFAFEERFGQWVASAIADGPDRTRWSITTDTPESLYYALGWIPAGVDYTIEGSEKVLGFVREIAERMMAASLSVAGKA